MRIKELLAYLDSEKIPYSFSGNPEAEFESFSSLGRYKPGSLTWVKAEKNIPEGFDLSQIALAIVSEGVKGDFRNAVYTPQSKRAFFSSLERFYGDAEERPAVGQFTYISPKVKLGKNVRIGHNCALDGDITVGDNTVIGNNVTIINRVVIGADCDIHSGVVIGHDGFSYTEDEKRQKKMTRHFGGVVIGNRAYLGMNVVIERGVIDDTTIGDGAKIDCMCLIGHNSVIGENAALVGGTTLYGSVHVAKNAYLAGPLVRNQISIGENAFVGLGALVLKDVEPGQTVVGNPAKPFARKSDN